MKRAATAVTIGLVAGAAASIFLLRPARNPPPSPSRSQEQGQPSPPGPQGARATLPSAVRARPFKPLAPAPRVSNGLVTDQNDPGYDVTQVVKVLDVTVAAAFDSETRDPRWAPRREQYITDIVGRDLQSVQARAELVSTECRHSTCQLVFAGPTLEEAGWGSLLIQYATLGVFTEPGQPVQDGDRVYLPVFVAVHPDERSNDGWQEYYAHKRKVFLADRRQRPHPGPHYPPVPVD